MSDYKESELEPYVDDVKQSTRLSDKLRLRELELQTQYRIQFLTGSLENLKSEFDKLKASVNEDIRAIKFRTNLIACLLIAQIANLDVATLISLFAK